MSNTDSETVLINVFCNKEFSLLWSSDLFGRHSTWSLLSLRCLRSSHLSSFPFRSSLLFVLSSLCLEESDRALNGWSPVSRLVSLLWSLMRETNDQQKVTKPVMHEQHNCVIIKTILMIIVKYLSISQVSFISALSPWSTLSREY